MPNPGKNENHEEFIQRCMGFDDMVTRFKDNKQRYAVCESMWKQHKAKSWVEDVLDKDKQDKTETD